MSERICSEDGCDNTFQRVKGQMTCSPECQRERRLRLNRLRRANYRKGISMSRTTPLDTPLRRARFVKAYKRHGLVWGQGKIDPRQKGKEV
jgi:hypothetical protein